MSRMFLITVVMASSLSSASAQVKEEHPVPAGAIRVAIVNIGVVFNKYERARQFKDELEAIMAPFKEQGKVLTAQIEEWQTKALAPEIDPTEKKKLEADILKNKRQLEDLQREISRKLGKKQEDNLVQLWKEVQDGIKTYATQEGLQLVLGYGDPMEKQLLDQFPNINRKMQAMDLGSTVPLFAAPGVDIAEGVVALLNRNYAPAKKANALKRFVD
jgi:Skp family chaperone for outer membrane proteins